MPKASPTERLIAAGFAVVFLVVGVIGIAESWATAGWIVLLGLCLVCVVFAVFASRITETEVNITPKGVTVKTKLASDVVNEIAASGFGSAAATYAFIHTQLADDPDSRAVKVKLQDELVAVTAMLAAEGKIKEEDVVAAIRTGIQAARPLAFGVLAAQPQWATVDLLLQGISRSNSGNEQYHALRAANAAWGKLAVHERKRVQDAARTAPWINDDLDRRKQAENLLARPLTP